MIAMIQLIAGSRAFLFVFLTTKFIIQEEISPYFFKEILIIKHSLDVEMSLEEEEMKKS